MADLAAFVRTWETWDRVEAAMPRFVGPRYGEHETNRMETSCQQLAADLGMPCSRMRDALLAARREGMGYVQAVEHVVGRRRPDAQEDDGLPFAP